MTCSSTRLAAFLVVVFLVEQPGVISVSTTLPTSAAETTVDGTSTLSLISETTSSISSLDPFTTLDPFTGSSYSFESTSDVSASIGSSDGASPFTSSVTSSPGETNGLDSTMTSMTTPAPTTTVYTGPTTTRTTTTTTINPLDYIRCGSGNFLDGINVYMIIMDVGVIQFACMKGFKETAEGAKLITCNQRTKRWDHDKALVCEPVEPPYEPPEEPEGPPAWIPVLVIMLLVVLILAVVGMVLLAVYACRRKPIQKSTTIVIREAQEAPPPPPPPATPPPATPPPTPPKKEKTQTKWWWPWKPSPPKPPPGHIGMDGIAWNRMGANVVLPVKRRL